MPVTQQQIERALASATVKAEMAKGQDVFKLSYVGAFKVSFSMIGSVKGYNLTGKPPEPGTTPTNEPHFLIIPSLDKEKITDVKGAAQHLFLTLGSMTGRQVQSEREVSIAGLRGYEIVGEGTSPKASGPLGLYIVMLSGDKGGHYTLVGGAPAAEMPNYLPEFQKIAAGFQPKSGD
jgi:hypothetical protein